MTSATIDPRLTRPAGIRTIQLGRLTISYVPDGHVQLPGRSWLPTTTDEFWAGHPEYLDDAGKSATTSPTCSSAACSMTRGCRPEAVADRMA
ncbi:hypothetical protein [Nonomuraea africana]|uniref:hypothetical protein n=1 Tax=Nonomuraea africana TaxID=46171 RepID=UPI0033E0E4E6